jgi:hypothetical protein
MTEAHGDGQAYVVRGDFMPLVLLTENGAGGVKPGGGNAIVAPQSTHARGDGFDPAAAAARQEPPGWCFLDVQAESALVASPPPGRR